jgi:hypothetical protein
MRIQPRRFSESTNQNTRGAWCVSAVLPRYVSAIRGYLTRTVPPCMHKALRSVRRPHSRLILHWRGLGKNSQYPSGSRRHRPRQGGRLQHWRQRLSLRSRRGSGW